MSYDDDQDLIIEQERRVRALENAARAAAVDMGGWLEDPKLPARLAEQMGRQMERLNRVLDNG